MLAGLGGHVAGHRAHLAGDLADLLFGLRLRLALQADAFLDQRLEQLAAFFLRLGEGAQAGEPDLLG